MLATVRGEIAHKLRRAGGTDASINEADRYGDGDQSPLTGSRQTGVYRDLWAVGGDLNECMEEGAFPDFVMTCLCGNKEVVKSKLEESNDVKALLEERHTSMRLSVLQIMVACCKNLPQFPDELTTEVVALLLKYGARPDARDLVGRTVCHYGMGAMATSGTLQKCDLCIRAQESAHLFGKRVESFGLGSPVLDGLKGTVGGFVNDRREVKLEDGRTVVFKPENLRLIDESGKPLKPSRRITKLVDIQDRMGYVALHELMETQRADMATELLEKYGARVDLPNWEGKSPAQNALIRGVGMVSPVANLVNMAAMKQGRDCYVCKRKTKENGNPLMACSKCKSIRYCSSACQKEDWDRHKPDCKKIQKTMVGTVTIKPEQLDTRMHHATLNNASRNTNPSNTIRRPHGVRVDEEFDIKVQANSNQFDMLIYDKARDCSFSLPPQAEGFDRLFQRVKVETRTNGTKAYFKASVNAAGYLVVKLGETTLKGW